MRIAIALHVQAYRKKKKLCCAMSETHMFHTKRKIGYREKKKVSADEMKFHSIIIELMKISTKIATKSNDFNKSEK